MSPREAVTRNEIGFAFTTASSALGSVFGSTNVLLRNVSGKSAMNPAFMTAFGDRISRPIVVNTQARPNENTTTSATAASTPSQPASGLKPRMTPTIITTVAPTT
jgi:hypothetical protein